MENLSPKIKLQSYYEHDYEGVLAVLKKNRKKLVIDPASREPGEALRPSLRARSASLGPYGSGLGRWMS